jgi:hypothetical protein
MGKFSCFLAAILICVALAPLNANESSGPISFFSNLSADEETAPTESEAVGHADLKLDRDTLRLSWKVEFKGLSTAPIGIAIHGPERVGVNAEVLYDLAPKGEPITSPIHGSVIMSDGALQYLMERHLYVNIRTAKYKEGELRGVIERVPPGGIQPIK